MKTIDKLSKAETRRQKIKQLMISNKIVSLNEFCEILHVSESTIRNDLKYLDEKGVLTRTYGGAVLNENTRYNIAMNTRYTMNIEQKEEIAGYVVEHLLKNNSIIFLDSGTTMVSIAKKILDSMLELTIITSSFAIASILSRNANIDLYITGGKLNHIKEAFIDQTAIDFASTICPDLYLFSCDGVDGINGYTIGDPEEVAIKKIVALHARKIICVIDSTKINQVKMKKIFNITEIDTIITDSMAEDAAVDSFRSMGVNMIKPKIKSCPCLLDQVF